MKHSLWDSQQKKLIFSEKRAKIAKSAPPPPFLGGGTVNFFQTSIFYQKWQFQSTVDMKFQFCADLQQKNYFFLKNNQNWHLSIIMHYIGNNSKIGVSAMENKLRGVYICCRCLNKVSYEFPIIYLTFPSETMLKYFKFVNICPHM